MHELALPCSGLVSPRCGQTPLLVCSRCALRPPLPLPPCLLPGFEFDVFSDFQPACSLPMQISMEVHFNVLGYNNADAKNFNNL